MPVTSTLFLIGSLSVATLPPLGGFVGEWLLLEGLLHGLAGSSTAVAIAVPIGVAALALTGGLTAAAFVKALGIGFLGRPRSVEAEVAHEVPHMMQLGTGLLAAACVMLGVFPMVILPALERAESAAVPGAPTSSLRGSINLHLGSLQGALSPVLLSGGLLAAVLLVVALSRLARLRSHVQPTLRPTLRRPEPWGSGRDLQTARMQYTATSFAEPLERVFDDVLRPDRDLVVSHVAESRYYLDRVIYRSTVGDLTEHSLYRPAFRAASWLGRRAQALQNGSVHRYLAYGLGALVVILVVLA
jgi:NADH:ubiquinone oxidoreductase subunit 5 (subunit L)/multisubunit Na+/H+ antiporter MnhA subunit